MIDILTDDCIKVIKSNLSYIDKLCYKLSNKYNYNHFKLDNFRDVFIKRLLDHNIVPTLNDAKLFCDNLYNTGAYVAGSFILDCLHNTNYHGDIDIYDQTGFDLFVFENPHDSKFSNHVDIYDKTGFDLFHTEKDTRWGNHKCCQEEKDREFQNLGSDFFSPIGTGNDNLKFTQSLYKMGFASVTSEGSPDPIIRCFHHKSHSLYRPYQYGKYLDIGKDYLQIIPIKMKLITGERSFIPRFIKATFDLDICQNIFDGNKLYIKNLNKLIYKYDYIKPNTRFMLTVYPIENDKELDNTKNRMKLNEYNGETLLCLNIITRSRPLLSPYFTPDLFASRCAFDQPELWR